MGSVVFASLTAPALPLYMWLWGGLTVLIATAIGFAAGMWYARMSTEWAFERAARHVSRLFEVVMESLEKSQQACALLEKFPNLVLSSKQLERFERKRTQLQETVGRIVDRQQPAEPPASSEQRPELAPEDLAIEWSMSSDQSSTGVPTRAAFDSNLAMLLDRSAELEFDSGFLLVKVDKIEHLKARFGHRGADQFLRKMSSILCRAIRDIDLVCQFESDTFAVLLPGVEGEEGRRLARSIRDAVRNAHFRVDETAAEVLVTASFGYTQCQPHDGIELVLDRAQSALSKSQRRGRNQLHIHDGERTLHSVTE